MAEVRVSIGGRDFEVACHDGEEHFLQSAALLLDNEASALNEALGRMPETRMLLMSGLMLADKTASLEDQLKNAPSAAAVKPAPVEDEAAQKRARRAEAQLGETQTELAELRAEMAELQAKAHAVVKKATEAETARDRAEAKAHEAQAARDRAQAKAAEIEAARDASEAKATEAEAARDAAVSVMQTMVLRVEAAAEKMKKAG